MAVLGFAMVGIGFDIGIDLEVGIGCCYYCCYWLRLRRRVSCLESFIWNVSTSVCPGVSERVCLVRLTHSMNDFATKAAPPNLTASLRRVIVSDCVTGQVGQA